MVARKNVTLNFTMFLKTFMGVINFFSFHLRKRLHLRTKSDVYFLINFSDDRSKFC